LRAFLQQDLGERLNLEAESNGVKIKIKGAVADDIQTQIFYEIEDTNEDNQYMMNYHDGGVLVENAYDIMSTETDPRYYPPDLESDVNKEEKNLYQGKISLPPLTKDKGTIKLNITKLQKLIRDSSNPNGFGGYENMEYETGAWNFEIPVTKQSSIEYALDDETEIEGIIVRFDSLTIFPTATILQFSINNVHPEKRIDILNFDNLEVNNKKVKADMYGSSFVDSQHDVNWTTFQIYFDPLFGEKPKEVNAQFKSAYLTIEDNKDIELDASQEYPQTFEYAGSTISIDKLEIGQPSKLVISDYEIKNRAYESLQFQIMGDDGNEFNSMEWNTEGVLVDKNGKEYDMNEYIGPYEEIEQPRYFITVQSISIHNNVGEEVFPKMLKLYGYNSMKYLDNVVKISLE
jgi:hypothetical protein